MKQALIQPALLFCLTVPFVNVLPLVLVLALTKLVLSLMQLLVQLLLVLPVQGLVVKLLWVLLASLLQLPGQVHLHLLWQTCPKLSEGMEHFQPCPHLLALLRQQMQTCLLYRQMQQVQHLAVQHLAVQLL